MVDKMPSLFIPHGGGPCFFMEWTMGPADTWRRMGDWLAHLAEDIGQRPRAILVISAHWEEPEFTVTANPAPPLIYDYYGFPEHTYHLRYDAPGDPALAQTVCDLLAAAGIPSRADPERGFDHGVFIPFKLIYPAADIPIVQLSLKTGLDPDAHIAAGEALASLRDDNVLIVGSGLSFHNLQLMRRNIPATDAFDAWLTETEALEDSKGRRARLSHWTEAPDARVAHPREDHLLPLMVAEGAGAGAPGRRIFNDRVMGTPVSGYRYG